MELTFLKILNRKHRKNDRRKTKARKFYEHLRNKNLTTQNKIFSEEEIGIRDETVMPNVSQLNNLINVPCYPSISINTFSFSQFLLVIQAKHD